MIANFECEPHRFLSNFWPAIVDLDGVSYPTVEHAYQAAKSLDPSKRDIVRSMPTPGMAKRAGRRLKSRTDWDTVKVQVMRGLLVQKFAPGTELAKRLEATGNAALVEGNTWGDRFWGICDGVGKNTLGWLLMSIRAENRGADDFEALLTV